MVWSNCVYTCVVNRFKSLICCGCPNAANHRNDSKNKNINNNNNVDDGAIQESDVANGDGKPFENGGRCEWTSNGRRRSAAGGAARGRGKSGKFSVIRRSTAKRLKAPLFYGSVGRCAISLAREGIEEEDATGEVEKEDGDEHEEEEEEEGGGGGGNVKLDGEAMKNIMDGKEFRLRGKEMVDYIVDYMDSVATRRVTPEVKPGYLKPLLPSEAPIDPEPWEDIMADVDKKIMPGVLHWNHPHFFAYFASGNSYPTILADMLADATAMMGFSWASGPVCTELEIIMLDWYGKAIGLPDQFISSAPESKGGGVIQSSASECILVPMLAARHQALDYLLEGEDSDVEESQLLHRLVVYCNREAHSCVEKAAKICLVKIRILEPDDKGSLRGDTLRKAIEEDESKGLLPFFVSCIIGSTSSCTFDNLVEIGEICESRDLLWMHVDCAYAGSAFICPELRPLMAGIEHADSVNTNPNKWMLTCFDCSCLWVRDKVKLTQGLVVDPIYLRHEYDHDMIDFRHWQIPLSRRFRSLKLFFLFRNYGIKGLQNYIRNHIKLAKYFESMLGRDNRFEITNDVRMGLVCFRLKGPDLWTQELLAMVNGSGKIHMVPATKKNKYVIRFAVTYEHAKEEHIRFAWKVIQHYAEMVLEKMKVPPATPRPRVSSRQHSFTRSVSRELYKTRSASLYDGVSPIPVVDEDLSINVFDEVFAKSG